MPNNSIFFRKLSKKANFGQKGQKSGALNPNSVLCTDQAPSPGFCALNPGSALNPRTLNPVTTVFSHRAKICHDCFTNSNLRGNMTDFTKHFSASRMCRYIQIYILVIVTFKSTGKLSWIEPKMVMSHPSVMLHTIAMAC